MKRVLYILILGTVLSSCEREEGFQGPSLIDQFGEFNVVENLQISNPDVDFAAGESSFFTAEFSKSVNWEIVIKGAVSGAEKVISGSSRILDEDNASWDGSTTNLPMFKIEDCNLTLKVSYNVNASDTIISVTDSLIAENTIAVSTTKLDNGLLLADFETGINPDWEIFAQNGGNMSFNVTSNNSPQGNSYYDMGGNVDWDWLIGLVDFPATAYGNSTFDLNDNGARVYFNVMLNMPQGLDNPPIVLFQFREDDNNNGVFEEGLEDMYAIEIRDLEPGWQLVSLKYSDLASLVNGAPVDADG
ncbi:MAG: hypothetical protein P8N54_08940, partial [Flavobacteriales bacterium]|nr:hypothetical protein [Flavobacteriales bacterium]